MNIKLPLFSVSLALIAAGFSISSSAASLTYDTWTSNDTEVGSYKLTINDDGGLFNYNLTVDPFDAEALGLFIDLGGVDLGLAGNDLNAETGLSNVSPVGQVNVFDVDTSSNDCGPGCNLNGADLGVDLANDGGDGEWELVFRLGTQGWNGIQTFSFTTNQFGLSLDDFGLVAIRAQNLCSGNEVHSGSEENESCGDSDKAISTPGDDTPPPPDVNVPEPGSLALMALGLLGIGSLRRRT